MVTSDISYISQHYNINFIPFSIGNTVVFFTNVQHLSLDYCEKFKLARKETIDKLKWNMSTCFYIYYQYFSKHWQPSCSKVSVRMRYHKVTKCIRVNSFVEALINMVCELKITSGSKKKYIKKFMTFR